MTLFIGIQDREVASGYVGKLAKCDEYPFRAAMVHNQEVCMLSFQVLGLCHELCNSQTERDFPLNIMKIKLA